MSGNPRLGTIDDLLAQPVVLGRAGRIGREREDRFLVGRALLEPDALGDHRLEHLPAEHLLNLRPDVARQRRPLVVHRDDHAQDAQRRVGPRPHLLDRLEQVVGALEREVRRLDRDQQVRRRDQRVHRQQPERRRAVDDDVRDTPPGSAPACPSAGSARPSPPPASPRAWPARSATARRTGSRPASA